MAAPATSLFRSSSDVALPMARRLGDVASAYAMLTVIEPHHLLFLLIATTYDHAYLSQRDASGSRSFCR